MKHAEKIVVVTGGSQGIGLAIAERYADEGAQVVVGSRHKPEDLLHKNIQFKTLDVTCEESVHNMFNSVKEQYGRVDALINAAGVMKQASFLTTTLNDWEATLRINLTGTFLTSQCAAHLMKERGGCIINIGSIEGEAANAAHTAYVSSKGGVHALTRAIAVDLGGYNIRCNTICPGWINTSLNQSYFEDDTHQQKLNALKKLHPLGRLGEPADIAALACWLGSDDAQWVTGQSFTIDGGRTAKLPGIDC
ncbi:SDR family NAD(P)-dependent oxidoreductase [Salinimonas iocasae]|uniref:SDR family oxidoreductase n=1 Tax=Salinimonas iocasae TaxID=2572577 RepID=A0A5B7YA70_9ALTE|nr:SDR family oxidoreductase [Salinimonas iocasae]QCZ92531.1 SDR family oxidoreductase [Salinimonas iocasae]